MKKSFIAIIILLVFLIALLISYRYEKNTDPFLISIDEVTIIQEENNAANIYRLNIVFSITNTSSADFNNVTYSYEINEEAIPYIASRQTNYQSTPMKVTSYEKASKSSDLVCGFSQTWQPLLNSQDILSEYYHLSLSDLPAYLTSLTISLTWDGGKQTEVIPLKLDMESFAQILQS